MEQMSLPRTGPTMQPTKSPYHHGNLKAALVEAATKLIEEQGPASVSLREVARAVRVSHTAPYRHFPNKQVLLEEVAIGGFNALSDALDSVIEKHPNDPRQQMIEAGAAYVLEAFNNPQRAQLMFGGIYPQKSQTAEFRGAAEASFSRCVKIIQQGQQQGVFHQGSTRRLVLTFWSASHGLAMLLVADRFGVLAPAEDAETLWHGVAESLLAGFLTERR